MAHIILHAYSLYQELAKEERNGYFTLDFLRNSSSYVRYVFVILGSTIFVFVIYVQTYSEIYFLAFE